MSDFIRSRTNDVSLGQVIRRLAELDLEPASRLWIAFSGGVDSTVLLHAAARAFDSELVTVLHVNHGLSSNADAWETHCELVAARLGLTFVRRRIALTGRNPEFEGRRERLKVFDGVLSAGDVVATAHHLNDELESLMWQLATGRALVGIAEWRNLKRGRLWRPLLEYKRDELLCIARQNKWRWIEDESNLDVSLTRNALRHEVLPRLRKAFLDFESQLLRLKEPPLAKLNRAPIEAETLAQDSKRVRAWLHAFDITPKSTVVNEIIRQATARDDAQVLVRVSSSASVRRFKGLFFVVPFAVPILEHSINVGEDCSNAFGKLAWRKETVGLPSGSQLRRVKRKGGESLQLNERRVQLSKWFYHQNVPPWEREAWPLFYRDEQLVAVPGLGVASSACSPGGWVPQWRRVDPLL